MSTFTYEAMNSSGEEIKSEIDAANQEEALGKIRNLGYFPTRIEFIVIPIREKNSPTLREPDERTQLESLKHRIRHVGHKRSGLRSIADWTTVLLLIFAIYLTLIVPIVYWWNHDTLTSMGVLRQVWRTELTGWLIIVCLLVWTEYKKRLNW